MLKTKDIRKFLNKSVAVGVPHVVIDNRLFFYYGTLKAVDDEEITIETDNGIKLIPVERIQEIRESRW